MIFDGKRSNQITADEIRALVDGQAREDRFLDFKALYTIDDRGASELIKDVSAFANTDGGYIVIGITDDGTGRASGFRNVEEPERVRQFVRDRCHARIDVPVPDLNASTIDVDGNVIVIIHIPASTRKPHCAKPDAERHYFYCRQDDVVKLMTLAEIRDCFEGDRVGIELAAVRRELEGIRQQSGAAIETVQPVDENNVFTLRTLQPFLAFAEERFRSIIGTDPYFRLTATPVPLNQLDFRNQLQIALRVLEHPPELRAHGFDVSPESPFQRIDLGVACSQTRYHHLRFFWNGHLEFWCFMSDAAHLIEDFGVRERPFTFMSGLGFIERTENFTRLAKALFNSLAYAGDVRFELGFYNTQGMYLAPYAPDQWGYLDARRDVDGPHGPAAQLTPDLRVPDVTAAVANLPGDVGWRLVRQVYYRFRYGDEHVPYYDADYHTVLEERRPGQTGGAA